MTEPELLECLDGVAYIVDPDARIVAYGRRHWDAFARMSDAPELLEPENVLGLDLRDVIQGDDVRAVYLDLIVELVAGRRDGFAFSVHCDSPQVECKMRIAMTPVTSRGKTNGVLFQSIFLQSSMRPPLDIFAFRELSAVFEHERGLPVVTVCSFCQKVKWGSGPAAAAVWIPAAEYYRLGGSSEIRVSHGICNPCTTRLWETPEG